MNHAITSSSNPVSSRRVSDASSFKPTFTNTHSQNNMADDIVLPIPNLDLPQFHFTLTQSNLEHLHKDALKSLLEGIEKDRTSLQSSRVSCIGANWNYNAEMAPYYRALLSHSSSSAPTSPISPSSSSRLALQIQLPEDAAFLARMEKANEEELKKLDQRLEEAEKTEGETEIADALRARATYFTKIGDKVRIL